MKVWIDGAGALMENQKGKIAVVFEDGRNVLGELGNCTNNEAEYLALIEALKLSGKDDTIYTDSQLLVGQLAKGWKVKAANLKSYHATAKRMLVEKGCQLVWTGREYNRAGKLIENAKSSRYFHS